MFKHRLRSAAFSASLKYSVQKIHQAVDRLEILPSRNVDFVNRQAVKLAAVRLDLRRYSKLEDYVSHMNSFMARAAAEGAQFVAFPELTGMVPLLLLPKFDRILQDVRSLERSDENLREAFHLLMHTFAGFVDEVFVSTFSALASDWNLPVAAGSYYAFEGEQIVNRQLMFDQGGKLIGLQDKLILSELEHRLGVSAGDRVEVFDTALGRVALLTACDAATFEPFWIAEARGADIVVAGADPLGAAADTALYRANENHLCVVSPGVVVDTDMLRHSAPAAIRAPFATTRGQDGLIIEGGEVAVGRVDLDRIAADFDVYSADQNLDFIRRYCGTPSASPIAT